jgi:hypothetical protein
MILTIFNILLFAVAMFASSWTVVDLFVYSFNKQFYDLADTKEKLSIGLLYKEFIITSILWIGFYITCLL